MARETYYLLPVHPELLNLEPLNLLNFPTINDERLTINKIHYFTFY